MKKSKAKYRKELPRLIYTYFAGYEGGAAPSFSRFARSIGVTLSDLIRYREHAEFDRAYEECNEIRRDYLIESALCRRNDPSFTKFILQSEYSMGEKELSEVERDFNFTLEVVDN